MVPAVEPTKKSTSRSPNVQVKKIVCSTDENTFRFLVQNKAKQRYFRLSSKGKKGTKTFALAFIKTLL